MPEQTPGQVHCFGPFSYDAAQRLLFRDGQVVPLMPKALDTLHALVERGGRVVSKAELMQLVWPDCVVEDVGLARNISLLRKVLGDDAETYIQTVPKRGYRFVGGVAPPPTPPRRASGRGLAALAALLLAVGFVYWQFYRPSRYLPAGEGFASLAVVPFEMLGPEPEPAALSRGLAEMLAAEISKLDSVYVISPATVERYRGLRVGPALMARLLGLDMTLEGTIQKADAGLRIVVRLSDVHSGKLIWAETYDHVPAEAGDAQAQVARAVAGQIRTRLRQ